MNSIKFARYEKNLTNTDYIENSVRTFWQEQSGMRSVTGSIALSIKSEKVKMLLTGQQNILNIP